MTDILINDQEKTQGRPYGNGDGGGRDACIAARSQKPEEAQNRSSLR